MTRQPHNCLSVNNYASASTLYLHIYLLPYQVYQTNDQSWYIHIVPLGHVRLAQPCNLTMLNPTMISTCNFETI